MGSVKVHALLAVLVAAAMLFGCTGGGDVATPTPTPGPTPVPTATPAPTPSPTPAPTPATPTPAPTPTVAPTPQATPTPAPVSVSIQGMAFTPNSLTVPVGTTVTWTNNDGITHTVTSNTGVFNSGPRSPGGSFSYTFTSPGVYNYHCAIHTFMHGTVIVTP